MADANKDDEADGAPAVAAAIQDLDWDVRMTEVQRIEPDPEDENPEDDFAVTFAVDGPNASAEVEVMVTDTADIEVVAMALDTLHSALVAWADVIHRRKAELRTLLSQA